MLDSSFFSRLPLLLDGPPGDVLRARWPQEAEPVEALNLTQPERVQAVHRAFRQAGARLVRSNTAQGSRLALASHGLQERCEAINNTGSALVRGACGPGVAVLGCIGSLEERGLHPSAREQAYGQQAVYLQDTGVDVLLLEGFLSVEECVRVSRVARQGGDAPLLAVLRLGAAGLTGEGLALPQALLRLAGEGLDAVGVSVGAQSVDLQALLEPCLACGVPLAVLLEAHTAPGPGLAPAAFAGRLAPLAALGVAMLGGGTGAGPGHIRALAEALGQASPS